VLNGLLTSLSAPLPPLPVLLLLPLRML